MLRRYSIPLLTIAWTVISLAAPPRSMATDFPQWRGPSRDGRLAASPAPAGWPESLTRVWQVPAGAGLSSPVVAGERAYLLTRDGDDEVVTAFRLSDGTVYWRQRYPAPFHANVQAASPRLFPSSRGKGPFATPAIDGDRLLVLGVDRVLSSYGAATGELHWRKHLMARAAPQDVTYICPPCRNACDELTFEAAGVCPHCGMDLTPKGLETTAAFDGSSPNYYGAASSPLVQDGTAIVHVGNGESSRLYALDPASGAEGWTWDGPAIASSSPVVATLGGVPQVVVLTRHGLAGISLAAGQALWSHDLESNAQIVTPVVAGDLVVFATYRGPLVALRITAKDGVFSVDPSWQSERVTIEIGSPVVVGSTLYGLSYSDKGSFFALDVATGATGWASEGGQGRSGTVLSGGGDLLWLMDDGRLIVTRSDAPGFAVVARYPLATTPTWTTPAIVGDRILIKDADSLTLWKIAP